MCSKLTRQISGYPWHTVYRLLNGKVNSFPFSHMVCENFLHPTLFDGIREECRDTSKFRKRFENPKLATDKFRYSWRLTEEELSQIPKDSAVQILSQSLNDPIISLALKMIFKKEIEQRHSSVPKIHSSYLEVVDDRGGYGLLPHVDVPQKLITCLIYLADEGQNPALGTSLYRPLPQDNPEESEATVESRRPITRDDFVLVQTIPFKPNTALVFAPGQNTWHGVEDVDGVEARRAIQFQINLKT